MLRDTYPNSDNSHHHDLDWWAFRYIADELDSADRDVFELRLTQDQSARDAVVMAMEVSQKIFAARGHLPAREHHAFGDQRTNGFRGDQAVDDGLPQTNTSNFEPSTRRSDSIAETHTDYHVRWSSVTAVSAAVLLLAVGGYWFSQNSPATVSTSNQVAKGSGQPAEDFSKNLVVKIIDDADSVAQNTDGTPVLAAVWVESLDTSVNSFLADTREQESPALTDVVYFPEASNEECEWLWTALDGLDAPDAGLARESDAEINDSETNDSETNDSETNDSETNDSETNDSERNGAAAEVEEAQADDEDIHQTESQN